MKMRKPNSVLPIVITVGIVVSAVNAYQLYTAGNMAAFRGWLSATAWATAVLASCFTGND